jgi:hypothetical protein
MKDAITGGGWPTFTFFVKVGTPSLDTIIPGSINRTSFLGVSRRTLSQRWTRFLSGHGLQPCRHRRNTITPRTGATTLYLLIAICVLWKSTIIVMRASVATPFGV